MPVGVYTNINHQGFTTIPLILGVSAIVIGVGALIMVVSNTLLYTVRLSITAQQASALVHACVEEALFELQQDNGFIGSGALTIGDYSCNYAVGALEGSARLVSASSTILGTSQKARVIVAIPNPLIVTAWQEVAD